MGKVLVKMYLDESTLAAIDELAERESRSRSGMLGVIIRQWLTYEQPTLAEDVEPEAIQRDPQFQREVDQRIQREAIKPTLDQRRAEKQPHRHRYTTEVEGTRQGRAGVIQADFACACGETKRQPVKN